MMLRSVSRSSFRSVRFRSFHSGVAMRASVLGKDLHVFNTSGEKVSVDSVFANKKVVAVGVVGAFTGVCNNQLPKYAKQVDAFKAKGIDEVVCLTVNDPFVAKQWQNSIEDADKVTVLADSDASFANSLDLTVDLSAAGLGTRAKRYALVLENGEVIAQHVEAKPGELDLTDADSVLAAL